MAQNPPTTIVFSAEDNATIGGLCRNVLNSAKILHDPVFGSKQSVIEAIEKLWKTVALLAFSQGAKHTQDASDIDREMIMDGAWEEGRCEGVRVGIELGLKEAATDHEKELEKERVWGYDVGFALACEIERSRRSTEAHPPSARSLRSSTASTATQTISTAPDLVRSANLPSPSSTLDPAPFPSATAKTDSPISLDLSTPSSCPENDASVRAYSIIDENPKAHPAPAPALLRDFSSLRSDVSNPFGSLRRRHQRSPRAYSFHSCPSPTSRIPNRPRTFVLNIYPSTSKTAYADRDRRPPPSTTFTPSLDPTAHSSLAWDHDPRLRDLSRALTALGWVRPGGGFV
ncbi:hypothetical protein R3P38DRAFT_3102102 [Favolaschia claudopus]|uniref:Uncharacterized protein n=1 Tax=Favolaschia claudopus TaxID=2862362 RepID=A0AAV9ZLX1_9AGAR